MYSETTNLLTRWNGGKGWMAFCPAIPGHLKVGVGSWIEAIWVFPKIGVSQNGWFIMKDLIKMDDLGVPLFLETPISCSQHSLISWTRRIVAWNQSENDDSWGLRCLTFQAVKHSLCWMSGDFPIFFLVSLSESEALLFLLVKRPQSRVKVRKQMHDGNECERVVMELLFEVRWCYHLWVVSPNIGFEMIQFEILGLKGVALTTKYIVLSCACSVMFPNSIFWPPMTGWGTSHGHQTSSKLNVLSPFFFACQEHGVPQSRSRIYFVPCLADKNGLKMDGIWWNNI